VRLPYPERISLVGTFYFALLLCGIQLAERTDPIFSLGCFFFIIVAALAFNVGGGFTRPSGGYVFFYSTLTVIIGITWKAVLGEPADSNLRNPLLTISVFTFGITMMFVSVYLSTKLTTKRAILGKMVTDANMQTATVGCLIAGILLLVAASTVPGGSGSVISALNQLNRFFPMAIILGVIHTIRRSGGTRSTNLPVLLAAAFTFGIGILTYSKEGIITPLLCWLVAAASQRYKVTRFQLGGALFATFFIFQYLVPYAQYGRIFRGESGTQSFGDSLSISLSLLSDLGYVREQYLESSGGTDGDDAGFHYFDTPQGFFDRLQEFPLDDAIIEHTRQFGQFGFYPVIASFQNLVPHFIWKDKPVLLFGNVYAHEVGILAEEDVSTGVSFSPTAEAFHLMGWMGIFLVAPCLWLALFTLFDSLCGDVRKSPWGLLAIVTFAHAAPEGGIGIIAYLIGFTAFGIIFAAVLGAYLMPVIGTFFIGPEGIAIRRGAPIRSIPNRLHPRASSQI
jgi:hypothetical protein